jgi:hypothetical protein
MLTDEQKRLWAFRARLSPDTAWPVRRADGSTYAEKQPYYKKLQALRK